MYVCPTVKKQEERGPLCGLQSYSQVGVTEVQLSQLDSSHDRWFI